MWSGRLRVVAASSIDLKATIESGAFLPNSTTALPWLSYPFRRCVRGQRTLRRL